MAKTLSWRLLQAGQLATRVAMHTAWLNGLSAVVGCFANGSFGPGAFCFLTLHALTFEHVGFCTRLRAYATWIRKRTNAPAARRTAVVMSTRSHKVCWRRSDLLPTCRHKLRVRTRVVRKFGAQLARPLMLRFSVLVPVYVRTGCALSKVCALKQLAQLQLHVLVLAVPTIQPEPPQVLQNSCGTLSPLAPTKPQVCEPPGGGATGTRP